MQARKIDIGQAEVIDDFLLQIAAAPHLIKHLVLVSPFVKLAGKPGSSGCRLCNIIASVKSSGGTALLISEDSPDRRRDFERAIKINARLKNSLYLHEALHAKCGWVATRVGTQMAFLGSANLTDAGLNKNAEMVFSFRVNGCEGQLSELVGRIRNIIDYFFLRSENVSHNNYLR